MSDPTRLIEEKHGGSEGADALGRDLLRAARRDGLPAGERDRIWAAVATAALVAPAVSVAAPASVAASSGAAAAAPATASGAAVLAKVTVAAVVLGAASLAGYRVSRPPEPAAPSAAVSLPAPPRAVHPEAPREVDLPRTPAATPAPARVLHAPAPARPLPPSRLAAEGQLVVEARRALREGDAAGALSRLEAARAEFAGGALVQEREALTIEALSRTGRGPAAAARADAFLRAYPRSPHAVAVRVFATP